ncbi:MAG: glycosyltransferase [Candidatus Poribacteria bacterium]|nr:glycosyltransferase [Candidatus Poribacteria bacterium]
MEREEARKLRIVLSTWGSTGDIQPFIALSERLVKAGHDVRVCTSEIYRESFTKRGVDFCTVGVPFEHRRLDRAMDAIIQIKNPLKSAILIAKEGILYEAEKWYKDCLQGMKGYDLAICHSADVPGQEAAIRHKLPWVTVSYCPGFIKTSYDAPAPAPNLGAPFNVLLWKLVEWQMRKQVDALFNRFIAAIGGAERELIGLDGMYSPELNLIAASPNISNPPPDLPAKHKFTGPWFLDEPDYEISPDLQAFLTQGSPPIIVSFGSMGGSKNVETTRILVDAVQRAGQRAIIQAGWGNLRLEEPPAGTFFVGYVPHNFLFRQGACVIHHGGAGTTAAACRAGVPSIIIPHLADQSYWGHTLRKLGVAPKPLYRRDMTPKRLAKRIHAVISSKSMAERAPTLGQKINAEDGLTAAVELIEAFAEDKGILAR